MGTHWHFPVAGGIMVLGVFQFKKSTKQEKKSIPRYCAHLVCLRYCYGICTTGSGTLPFF